MNPTMFGGHVKDWGQPNLKDYPFSGGFLARSFPRDYPLALLSRGLGGRCTVKMNGTKNLGALRI